MRMPRTAAPRAALWIVAGTLLGLTSALAQDTLTQIREQGRVTVAVADEEPYGYRAEDGHITGEGPEIARAILARLNPDVEIEWVVTQFSDLITGLQEQRFDITAAGMFITPERCRQVAFSNPTYVIGEAFVVRDGNPRGLTDYWSIAEDPDARVGVMAGAVEYNYALVAGIPAEQALIYRTLDEAAEALQAGEIDAIGATSLSAQALADENKELATTAQFYPEVDGTITRGYGAFAFRQADRDLVEAFNRELADFLGTEQHWQTVDPFGFGPDMLPDKTAAELCQG